VEFVPTTCTLLGTSNGWVTQPARRNGSHTSNESRVACLITCAMTREGNEHAACNLNLLTAQRW